MRLCVHIAEIVRSKYNRPTYLSLLSLKTNLAFLLIPLHVQYIALLRNVIPEQIPVFTNCHILYDQVTTLGQEVVCVADRLSVSACVTFYKNPTHDTTGKT